MLDIYDENLSYLGTKDRDAVHHDGDWHRVFHCWIIYCDEAGQEQIVVQRRSPGKQFFPNMLDVTAAGHYEAGETIRDGVREIKEELGLDVAIEDLIPLGMRADAARCNDLLDYEFSDVFFLINDQPLTSYMLEPGEVAGLARFSVNDGLALFAGECESIRASAVGFENNQIIIHETDFVPRVDAYVYKILILATRCLNGEKHLVI